MKKRNPKDYTIHMIANAHLDPIWLWCLPEGLGEAVATCRMAVKLLEEYPDYIFTRGEALIYEWIEQVAPELFEKIRHFVKIGRWHIVNGFVVQPDCNLPCGESFVRQALYGKRYFKEKFGVDVKIGYCVDAFGHNAGLPQIYKKSGYSAYLFFRPAKNELKLPGNIFSWEGVDGSRILAIRPDGSYQTEEDNLEDAIFNAEKQIPEHCRHGLCFIGVGNHEGGATREILEIIKKLKHKKGMPTLRFSNLEEFIKEYLKSKPDIPVYQGELEHHAQGCYSTVFKVKKLNRSTEHLLLTAEKFAVVEETISSQNPKRKVPRNYLKQAWENLLLNQFHDVLPGTSISEAYADVFDIFGASRHSANKILWISLQKLAEKIDTQGEGTPVVIFNPHSWQIKAPVDIEWMLGYRPKKEKYDKISVIDDTGKKLISQLQQSSSITGWQWRKRICFVANIPAFGYRVFKLLASPGDFLVKDSKQYSVKIGKKYIENKFLKLTWGKHDCFTSLFDKKNNMELFSGSTAEFIVIKDESDTWGHGKLEFRDEIGRFRMKKIEILERGPVQAVVRGKGGWNKSKVEMDWILYNSLFYVDLRVTVDWREKHKILKLSFPLNACGITTAEIPYGAIERSPSGTEEPMNQWIDVSGDWQDKKGKKTRYGLAIADDSLYGYDIKNNEVRVTILRSPLYAMDQSGNKDKTVRPKYMNQGIHSFKCRLIPHSGSWQKAQLINFAYELNQPPIPFVTYSHQGPWTKKSSWISIKPNNLLLTSMKMAEDSDNIILRLFESTGVRTLAKVNLPVWAMEIRTFWQPFEIKSISINIQRKQWSEVDLMEKGT